MISGLLFLGCTSVIPQVNFSGPPPFKKSLLKIIEHNKSFEGSHTQRVLGKGDITGRITKIEFDQDHASLNFTVSVKDGDYKIYVPMWEWDFFPFNRGSWVNLNYIFDDKMVVLQVFEQGRGEVLIYYNGIMPVPSNIDMQIQCKRGELAFLTDTYYGEKEVPVEHFYARCVSGNKGMTLIPGKYGFFISEKRQLIFKLIDCYRKRGELNTPVRISYLWSPINNIEE